MSTSNNANPSNSQVFSAAAQSQGNQQQPQRSGNTDSHDANYSSDRSAREFRCSIPGCEDNQKHARRFCNVFLSLPAGAKWDIVKGKGWCLWCLGHSADKSCFAIGRLEREGKKPECGENGCQQPHHPALHHIQGNLSSHRWRLWRAPWRQPLNRRPCLLYLNII